MIKNIIKAINPMNWGVRSSTDVGVYTPPMVGGFKEVGGLPIYPKADIQTYYDLFKRSPHLYTVVDFIGERFMSVAWHEYQIKSKKDIIAYRKSLQRGDFVRAKGLVNKAYDEVDNNTKLGKLLMNPNPMMTQDMFLKAWIVMYCLGGEAAIWLNRGLGNEGNDKKEVLEMWLIPSTNLLVVPWENDIWTIKEYILRVDGYDMMRIPKEDLIFTKEFNLDLNRLYQAQHRGLSPLESGLRWITALDAMDDAITSTAQNGGARGILFETQDGKNGLPMLPRNPAESDAIKKALEGKINSNRMRDAVMYMSTGYWNYVQMGQSARDMQTVDTESAMFKRLCNLYKVPPVVFSGDSAYNNVTMAFKSFVSTVLIPKSSVLRDALNKVLPKSFGLENKAVIEYDVTVLPEMQQDTKEQVDYLSTAWWLTMNEKRAAMNYEEIEGGDEVFIPSSYDNVKNIINDINTID